MYFVVDKYLPSFVLWTCALKVVRWEKFRLCCWMCWVWDHFSGKKKKKEERGTPALSPSLSLFVNWCKLVTANNTNVISILLMPETSWMPVFFRSFCIPCAHVWQIGEHYFMFSRPVTFWLKPFCRLARSD